MNAIQAATIFAAVAAGVSSGTTYTFSTFVMRALDRLPQTEAIQAMQSINVQAINPWFLAVFVGTAPALVALAVVSTLNEGFDVYLWASAAIYLFGVGAVTGAGNVPLNESLEAVSAATATEGTWVAYSRPWTMLNHVRSAAAALASLILVYSLTR